MVHEVAAFELAQAGMLAEEASLERAAEEEERGGGAVVAFAEAPSGVGIAAGGAAEEADAFVEEGG